jgi:hypothetical protein
MQDRRIDLNGQECPGILLGGNLTASKEMWYENEHLPVGQA